MKKIKLIMIGLVLGIAIVLGQHRTNQSSEQTDHEEITV